MKELGEIQNELKAPKGQKNTFGNYNYRSCEDILEAVKPILQEKGCILLLSDKVVSIGVKNYIEATATLIKGSEKIHVTAYAREAETQKGMSDPQITGSASSYARKYALNGLFAIDDTKDDDATNEHDKKVKAPLTLNKTQVTELVKLIADKGTTLENVLQPLNWGISKLEEIQASNFEYVKNVIKRVK